MKSELVSRKEPFESGEIKAGHPGPLLPYNQDRLGPAGVQAFSPGPESADIVGAIPMHTDYFKSC
jgi:hypothetical protein